MTLEIYLPRLRSYAKKFLSNEWEDLVQDTVVVYLRNEDRYTLTSALLYTIINNLHKDRIKKHKEIYVADYDDISPCCYPDAEVLVYCNEVNIDIHEWPKNYSSKRSFERVEKCISQ